MRFRKRSVSSCLLLFSFTHVLLFAQTGEELNRIAFEINDTKNWDEVFFDSCTGDWTNAWFLDGKIASVSQSAEGMQLTAGPQFKNDAHHMVLWTKDIFEGDLKIEFEFTRLDFETRCVNILYIQAAGSNKGIYDEDISTWNAQRKVPAMKTYFDHMNAYHISYAAFPNDGINKQQYIRARRYMPNHNGLEGTALKQEYFPLGLFEPGIPHNIIVVKKKGNLYMKITNEKQRYYCHFINDDLPAIHKGRIGLRLMYTRSSRFKNFKILQAKSKRS